MTESIQPVKLPAEDVSVGTIVTATGWGQVSDSESNSCKIFNKLSYEDVKSKVSLLETFTWLIPCCFPGSSGNSRVLREVDVPIMSNEDCDAVYDIIKDGMICIDAAGGKGTCFVSTSNGI